MAGIGINVSADGRHSSTEVLASGARAARIVLLKGVDQTPIFEDYATNGLQVLRVFAGESRDGFGNNREAFAWYAAQYSRYPGWWEIGNEPDLESPSSWTMEPYELSQLGWDARSMMPNEYLVVGGQASGWAGYLDMADIRWANFVGIHPYAKDMTVGRVRVARRTMLRDPRRANDLPDVLPLIRDYRRFGIEPWITEWGWWGDEQRGISEVGDMTRWAASTDEIGWYFHFCLRGMVEPFNLYRDDGSPKPAAEAFRIEASFQQQPTPLGPDLSAWDDAVGPGLLSMLRQDGAQPVAPSVWGVNGIDELVYADNGDAYIWITSAGRGYRVPPR